MDEETLRAARKLALDRRTSVNQLVRDYLERLVGGENQRKKAIQDMEEIFRTARVGVGKRKWTREELHER